MQGMSGGSFTEPPLVSQQAAKKPFKGRKKCQGTTLVVPELQQNQRGL
jgi:hypothetical protein